MHNPDWTAIAQDSKNVRSEVGRWIWKHNPERYAYQNYGNALDYLMSGAPFQNTNIPPGYEYEPWTIDQLFAKIDGGKKVKFGGDWS